MSVLGTTEKVSVSITTANESRAGMATEAADYFSIRC